jgi:hypothetical protein
MISLWPACVLLRYRSTVLHRVRELFDCCEGISRVRGRGWPGTQCFEHARHCDRRATRTEQRILIWHVVQIGLGHAIGA